MHITTIKKELEVKKEGRKKISDLSKQQEQKLRGA